MSLLTTVNRNASIAWCPIVNKAEYFATATSAGSTDSDFDTSGYLESFCVDSSSNELTLPSKKKIELPDRVHSLDWGSNGIIASGLPDGSISFVDGAPLIGESSSFESEVIAVPTKHNTPVSCLQFNRLQEQIMASGAENSEIFIWNLQKPESPVAYAPGTSPTSNESITDLKWNSVVPYILGTVSQNGRVIVWDLRNKRPAVQFTDRSGKLKNCKSISWNPKNSMQLVTASEDDSFPVVQVWNLKNTQMPVTTLKGHTQGVWSTSWCPHDDRYLLSSGKENKAICWDMENESIAHEIPLRSEWNSTISWSTNMPATFSVASYQGQVGIYTIHDVNGKDNGDGTFDHSTPPSWLRRPAGATFGFGGKLATVEKSTISIKTVVSHPEILDTASKVEELLSIENHEEYCESRVQNTNTDEEKEIWQFLGAQFNEDRRESILKQIGFNREDARKAVELLSLNDENNNEELIEENTTSEQINEEEEELETKKDEDDVSNLFGGASEDAFGESNEDDPFSGFSTSEDPFAFNVNSGNDEQDDPWSNFGNESKNEVSEIQGSSSNTRLNIIDMASKVTSPLHFLNGANSNEQVLVKNLLLKNYEAAVDACFKMNRFADGLIIAMTSNDSNLWERTQLKYYNSLPSNSALHLVDKISNNKLREVVAQADVDEWKCTLAIICSYANDDEEFASLCSDLGELLQHTGNSHAANLCFICANDLDRAVALWSENSEQENRLLQLETIIERICVLREAIGGGSSNIVSKEMINKYCEFAELLASQGKLEFAYQLVSSVTDENTNNEKGRLLINRIKASIDSNELVSQHKPVVENYQVPVQNQTRMPENQNPTSKPIQSQPTSQPFGVFNPVQPVTQPIQPVSRPVVQQPIKPIQPVQAPSIPQPVFTPFQPQPAAPVQPPVAINQPQRSVVAPSIPNPVNTPQPVANIYNPYAAQSQPNQIPPQETLPAAVLNAKPKEEEKPGPVEIADNLASAIQQWTNAQQGNPTVLKNLKGCSNDRVEILKEKLRKNELASDTIDELKKFVSSFASGDKQGVAESYQWLTKNKYQEVSAKVMLGLKKLQVAVQSC